MTADPAATTLQVRISDVQLAVRLEGDDPVSADAVRRLCRPFEVSVPATPDHLVEVPSDSGESAEATVVRLRRDLLAGVAEVHARRGYLRLGVPIVVGTDGTCLALVAADDDDEARSALDALRAVFEVIDEDAWMLDPSGAIVRVDLELAALDDRRATCRLIGAVLLGDADPADADPADADSGAGFADLVALARHVLSRADPAEHGGLLHGIRMIGSAAQGVSRIPARDLPAAVVLVAGLLADALDGDWASAFPSGEPRSSGLPADLDTVFDLHHRGLLSREPAWVVGADVVWISDDVQTVVVHTTDGSPPLALRDSAAVIWQEIVDHSGITLDRLVALCAARFDVDETIIRSQIADLLGDLRRLGLIGWA